MSVKTTIYQILNNSDICHRCQKSDTNLVSPCGNNECEAKFHRDCLTEQIEENNNVCPKCSQSIVSNKVKKLNSYDFSMTIINIGVFIFMNIMGSAIPGLLIFGTYLDGHKLSRGETDSFVMSILVSAFTGFGYIVTFVCLYILFELKIDEYHKTNNLFLRNMAIISAIIDSIILLCHFFGFFIMKFYYNAGNHFDCESFTMGFFLISVCIIVCLIILGILYGCKLLYNKNLKEEIVYGV